MIDLEMRQKWMKGIEPIRFKFMEMLSRIKLLICGCKCIKRSYLLSENEKIFCMGYYKVENNIDIIAIV
jgi:hypothetical protein